MDRIPDPYRELGILRGATDAQVKAAHRRLAKRFHPDAPEGDHDRFLAIQEAYSLLSDPLRRRDWDAAHAAGPVRAGDPGRPRGARGGRGGPPTARPARGSGASAGGRAAGAAGAAPGNAGGTSTGAGGSPGARGGASGDARRAGATGTGGSSSAGGAWSASDREPASRSTTWSAAGVPWWEDFAPRDRGAGSAGAGSRGGPEQGRSRPDAGGPAGGPTAGSGHGPGAAGPSGPGAARPTAPGSERFASGGTGGRTTARRSPEDVDVYSRSSGAAWSMAARRYFRKGEAELPKGGAWTYRGTQVVTGGEARKVAEEEAAARRRAADDLLRSRAPGSGGPRDRTAFTHDAPPTVRSPSGPRPEPTGTRASHAASVPGPTSSRPGGTAGARTSTDPPSLVRRMRRALGLG